MIYMLVLQHGKSRYLIADEGVSTVTAVTSRAAVVVPWANTLREKTSRGQAASLSLVQVEFPDLRVVGLKSKARLLEVCPVTSRCYGLTGTSWMPDGYKIPGKTFPEWDRGVSLWDLLGERRGYDCFNHAPLPPP